MAVGIRIRGISSSRQHTTFPWMNQPAFANAWRKEAWDDTRKHFLAIRDSLEKTNARFIVVAAPYESQLRQDLLELDKEFTTTPQRMLKTMTSELNIPFLDLHPVFAVNSHKCLFRDGIHLANAGHRLVKDELVQFLTSESLVPDPIATEQQRISRIR